MTKNLSRARPPESAKSSYLFTGPFVTNLVKRAASISVANVCSKGACDETANRSFFFHKKDDLPVLDRRIRDDEHCHGEYSRRGKNVIERCGDSDFTTDLTQLGRDGRL